MTHPAVAPQALVPRQARWQPWRLAGGALRYLLLGVCGFTMVMPFFWLFTSSLKTPLEAIAEPPVWIPKNPQWQSYLRVLTEIPMGRYYLNSLMVAGTVTLLAVVNGALAGYALAKLRFRGKEMVFRGILATLMLPSFLFLIPVYFMMRRAPLAGGNDIFGLGGSGLLHTHWSMILPFATSAFGIFLMRQFILTIPEDLLDAARIDGCSEFRIFWQIVLPLTTPATATLAIFTFIGQWNNFLWPLLISTSAQWLRTVPVGLRYLNVQHNPLQNQNMIFAGLAVGILPAFILFLLLQRYYIEGITLSGLKE